MRGQFLEAYAFSTYYASSYSLFFFFFCDCIIRQRTEQCPFRFRFRCRLVLFECCWRCQKFTIKWFKQCDVCFARLYGLRFTPVWVQTINTHDVHKYIHGSPQIKTDCPPFYTFLNTYKNSNMCVYLKMYSLPLCRFNGPLTLSVIIFHLSASIFNVFPNFSRLNLMSISGSRRAVRANCWRQFFAKCYSKYLPMGVSSSSIWFYSPPLSLSLIFAENFAFR